MKRLICLICLICLLCLLCGCVPGSSEPVATPAPTVEATPSPHLELCGLWTDEYTGTTLWELRDDGTAKIPVTQYDDHNTIGGYGTWMPDDSGDVLTVTLDGDYTLRVFTEDGYTKLWSHELQQTLVRAQERVEARNKKYVDVTITTENFWDYFYFEEVPNPVDEDGLPIYKRAWVMRSSLYNDGLVYWDSHAFDASFVYWTSYRLHCKQAPFGVNFYVRKDEFNSMSAEGVITFVKPEYISEYAFENNCRTVALRSGESHAVTFDGLCYEQYPY